MNLDLGKSKDKTSIFGRFKEYIRIKKLVYYWTYLAYRRRFISRITKYYPFSNFYKGYLYHYQFRIERKIFEYFEDLANKEDILIILYGFDSDKHFSYYVFRSMISIDTQVDIKKLQKIFQKVDKDFYVRQYGKDEYKILMPWSNYLKLREKYERKYD